MALARRTAAALAPGDELFIDSGYSMRLASSKRAELSEFGWVSTRGIGDTD